LKRPRLDPLSDEGLRRKTRNHLRRYWPSVAQMRRVLTRHIDRNHRRWGGDREAARARIDPLLEEQVESGALNDARFTRSWVEQLDRKGMSRLAIRSKMREKGVSGDLVEAELSRVDAQEGDRELLRAIAYARRRRLGPAQTDALRRESRRKKDLAAMARAGFSYGIAKRVVDSEDLDELVEGSG
jgi:regulatory protein